MFDFLSPYKLVIALGLALAVSVLVGWLFWSRASLKTELVDAKNTADTWEAAAKNATEAVAELRTADAEKEKALANREKTIRNINAQRDALRRQLGEVLTNDASARDWANSPVPDTVRQLLRN